MSLMVHTRPAVSAVVLTVLATAPCAEAQVAQCSPRARQDIGWRWRAGKTIEEKTIKVPRERAELDSVLQAHQAWLNEEPWGQRANLQFSILPSASLPWAKLQKADLRSAQLQKADLCHADLTEALLNGAHLDGARLVGARLDWAQLDGASLAGAVLDSASLFQANLNG